MTPDAAGPTVDVEHITKRFGDHDALVDVSFQVQHGTVLALLGPNGAGKTTVINCLATLERAEAGRAVIAGCDVFADPAGVRQRISLTGQFAALDLVLTGRQNLVLFGRLLGLSKARAKTRAADLLEQFDLVEAADRPVKGYSGGMRRRLDLAVTLVVPRCVLFLDEPSVGLDPISRRDLWKAIGELRDEGTTIVLTTQYLEEADHLADQVIVIDHGRVVASGTPSELKGRIANLICSAQLDRDEPETGIRSKFEWASEVTFENGELIVHLDGFDQLSPTLASLSDLGVAPETIEVRRPSLDDVFLELTRVDRVDVDRLDAADVQRVG